MIKKQHIKNTRWDFAYERNEKCVDACKNSDKDLESIAKEVCDEMNAPWFLNNPLFKKMVYSTL